jgi:hypothetical protein
MVENGRIVVHSVELIYLPFIYVLCVPGFLGIVS